MTLEDDSYFDLIAQQISNVSPYMRPLIFLADQSISFTSKSIIADVFLWITYLFILFNALYRPNFMFSDVVTNEEMLTFGYVKELFSYTKYKEEISLPKLPFFYVSIVTFIFSILFYGMWIFYHSNRYLNPFFQKVLFVIVDLISVPCFSLLFGGVVSSAFYFYRQTDWYSLLPLILNIASLPAYVFASLRRFMGSCNDRLPYSAVSATRPFRAILFLSISFALDNILAYFSAKKLTIFVSTVLLIWGIFELYVCISNPYFIHTIGNILSAFSVGHVVITQIVSLIFTNIEHSKIDPVIFRSVLYVGNIIMIIVLLWHKLYMYTQAAKYLKTCDSVDIENFDKRQLFFLFQSKLTFDMPEKFPDDLLQIISEKFPGKQIEIQSMVYFIEHKQGMVGSNFLINHAFKRTMANTQRFIWTMKMMNILSIASGTQVIINGNQTVSSSVVNLMLDPCHAQLAGTWKAALEKEDQQVAQHMYGLAGHVVAYSTFFDQKRSAETIQKRLQSFTFDRQTEDSNEDGNEEQTTIQNMAKVYRPTIQKVATYAIIILYVILIIFAACNHICLTYIAQPVFSGTSSYSGINSALSSLVSISMTTVYSFIKTNPNFESQIDGYAKAAKETPLIKGEELNKAVDEFVNYSKLMANTPLSTILNGTADHELLNEVGLFTMHFVADLLDGIEAIKAVVSNTVADVKKVFKIIFLVTIPMFTIGLIVVIVALEYYMRSIKRMSAQLCAIEKIRIINGLNEERKQTSTIINSSPLSIYVKIRITIIISYLLLYPIVVGILFTEYRVIVKITETNFASQNYNLVLPLFISQLYLIPASLSTEDVQKEILDVIVINLKFLNIFTLEANEPYEYPVYEYTGLAHPEPKPIASTALYPFQNASMSTEYLILLETTNHLISTTYIGSSKIAPKFFEWRFVEFIEHSERIGVINDHVSELANVQYLWYYCVLGVSIAISFLSTIIVFILSARVVHRMNVELRLGMQYLADAGRVILNDGKLQTIDIQKDTTEADTVDIFPCGICFISNSDQIVYENQNALQYYGNIEGDNCSSVLRESVDNDGYTRYYDVSEHAAKTFSKEIKEPKIITSNDITVFKENSIMHGSLKDELLAMRALPSSMGGTPVLYLRRSLIMTVVIKDLTNDIFDCLKMVLDSLLRDSESLFHICFYSYGICIVFNPPIAGKNNNKYIREAISLAKLIVNALGELALNGKVSIVPGGQSVIGMLDVKYPHLVIISRSLYLGNYLLSEIEYGSVVIDSTVIRPISSEFAGVARQKKNWNGYIVDFVIL